MLHMLDSPCEMTLLRFTALDKACSMLCIALALIFACVSLSSAVDRVQHARGASTAHEHLFFSDLTIEDAHDQGHHQSDTNDQSQSDFPAGDHHHHGDSGSGLVSALVAPTPVVVLMDDTHGLPPARPPVGFQLQGPERPPKNPPTSA